jgi:hypothetical protein
MRSTFVCALQVFSMSLFLSFALIYPAFAENQYFKTDVLRDLREKVGSFAVVDLLRVSPQDVRFYCVTGPYGSPYFILPRYATDSDDLKILQEFVRKSISIGASEGYLIVVTKTGMAALPFGKWRVVVLGQHGYFCDTDLRRRLDITQ